MGFDPPTAREAGSGVNGCRFLGIPHGYTPGGASHARKHRTSAASALAISAVGAGETESNHVYCRISFEIIIALFMHSAFRGRGRNVRRTRFRSAIWLPHAGAALQPARRRAVAIRLSHSIRGIAIGAELLRTGDRESRLESRSGPSKPRRPDRWDSRPSVCTYGCGIRSTLPAVLKYTHTLMHASSRSRT